MRADLIKMLPRICAATNSVLMINFLLASIVLNFSGCAPKNQIIVPDPAFSQYVSAFTAGEISVEAPIIIQLAEKPTGLDSGKLLPAGLFRFSPSVKGEAILTSGGAFQFRPSQPLNAGTLYTCTFQLGKLLELEPKFREFRFSFSTIKQNFRVEDNGLQASATTDRTLMTYSGKVVTADVANPVQVEKVMQVLHVNKPVKLNWSHSPDRLSHTFFADSIVRNDTRETKLVVDWKGESLGVKNSGKSELTVPALSDFIVLNVQVLSNAGQQIIVTFSDALATDQPLEGMVELEKNDAFTWNMDGNRLMIWPSAKLTGDKKLTIYKGLKNQFGASLAETAVLPVFFSNLKPQVRLIGKGVIVPDKGSLSFPFEAVSLKAVDLRIIKIFASNIRQFLQSNEIDGEDDLKKVGRLVYSGKVELMPETPEQLQRWNTYRIDLQRYITPEAGAIYRVELRFRRTYSVYDCGSNNQLTADNDQAEEDGDWDSPGWYNYYYWPRNYSWEQRDNPCNDSYYTSERFAARNIFSSNLGILAKEGKGYQFTFVVTSLSNGLPEPKAEITLFSYQHLQMGTAVTNAEGIATLQLSQKPFVALVRKGNQTGYLRIDDASSLSLSNFDVTGEEVQEGVKGFLYGERGVWRPGDKMFLTFILDDPKNRFPENTPVIFKLINSRGQEVEKLVSTAGENGFYHFPVQTRVDDPTGNWYARVFVGGASFEKRLKVETVKPNRLKIELKLPQLILAEKKQEASLNAAWLHGASAANLKSVVEVEMFAGKTTFKGYEKFTFTNPAVIYRPSKKVVFEGNTDSSGNVVFPLDFGTVGAAAGKLNAWFTTRVFEPGGDFSIQVHQTEFSPFPKYFGLKMPDEDDSWYKSGVEYFPELVALSPDGKLLPIGKAEISLFKVDWRWWWESGDDYLAQYVSGRQFQPIKKWNIASAKSSEKFSLMVEHRDWRDNGRYFLFVRDPESGHASGITFYLSEYGGWRNEDMPDGATMLSIRTDKAVYQPGEKIRVTIPSSPESRALVSIENGKQVEDIFWVKTVAGETTFDIEVKPGMAPTLYIYVTLIQPYGSAGNDAPIRLYGVQAVEVNDPATFLKPVVQVKDELEPGKDFQVTVREQTGKPMTYTLAIVDEGLLDLTGFKTPDPHAAFYAREALGVKTYDLFDLVAGAYGARLEKAFAVGGDEELAGKGKKNANRFKPVVLYAGPFTLAKGGNKAHNFRMPDYVGSVKVMVVAGAGQAFGNAEKAVKVRKAVMLLATLPRVAGPGEEISLPVSVFALKETTGNVVVSVETNSKFTVQGEKTATVQFNQPGDKMVWFKLKAGNETGIGTVKVTARSGSETATYEIEMDVRNPNPPVYFSQTRLIEPGQKWSAEAFAPGLEGTNQASLEISTIPNLNLSKHIETLVQYPYGCVEQMVSIGLGQLFLGNLVLLDSKEKLRAEENISAALSALRGFQTPTGGFAYWPGQSSNDEWSTSYAGHFMLLAAQKGYSVPVNVKNMWISHQRNQSRLWKPNPAADPFVQRQEALLQAYRLYTLALAGTPEQGVMNRFREEVKHNSQARWRLAATYLLTGQQSAAAMLLQQAKPEFENYSGGGSTFGSQLRDKAMILETLILQKDRKQAFLLLQEMAREISETSWLSTQTAAWSFYSIARFFGDNPVTEGWEAAVGVNGKTDIRKSVQPTEKLILAFQQKKVSVNIDNKGKVPLFVRLTTTGIPKTDTLGSVQDNLQTTSWFTDRAGNKLDPASLSSGTDIYLYVKVKHPGTRGPYQHLALAAVFPSGWEIMNQRLNDIPSAAGKLFDYQDIRDDRVNTYFGLNSGESRTFKFMLSPAYEGSYFLPAMVCEGMYDNSIYSRLPGMWIKVTGRPEPNAKN